MVGVVFSKGPAGLLAMLTPEKLDATFWLWVIIIYYFIATFVPIDKVIGKIYPVHHQHGKAWRRSGHAGRHRLPHHLR